MIYKLPYTFSLVGIVTMLLSGCQPKIKKAEAFFDQKKYVETVDITNGILLKDSMDVDALKLRAKSNEAIGLSKEATKDYKNILRQDPANKEILFALGEVYKGDKLYNEAIEAFSVLLSLQPDYPFAYYERGFCYDKMGLFPQARSDMESSIHYKPDYGPTYMIRGHSLEALGNLKLACEDYQKAFDLGVQEAQIKIMSKCADQ